MPDPKGTHFLIAAVVVQTQQTSSQQMAEFYSCCFRHRSGMFRTWSRCSEKFLPSFGTDNQAGRRLSIESIIWNSKSFYYLKLLKALRYTAYKQTCTHDEQIARMQTLELEAEKQQSTAHRTNMIHELHAKSHQNMASTQTVGLPPDRCDLKRPLMK